MRMGRATYGIAAARVDVAQPLDDAVYFVELVAVLGIILVNVEGKQGGIDRSVCVQRLHSTKFQHLLRERTSVGEVTHVDVYPARSAVVLSQMRREFRRVFERGVKIAFSLCVGFRHGRWRWVPFSCIDERR